MNGRTSFANAARGARQDMRSNMARIRVGLIHKSYTERSAPRRSLTRRATMLELEDETFGATLNQLRMLMSQFDKLG